MRYCGRALSVEYLNSAPQSFALDRQQPKTKRENVMYDKQVAAPDNTAVRVALWRALHVEVDSPPHVLEDEVGLKLAAPDDAWRSRPDMSLLQRAKERRQILLLRRSQVELENQIEELDCVLQSEQPSIVQIRRRLFDAA